MTKYIMRLDDACPRRDAEKWQRMEELLDKYSVRPLVGLIPQCRDKMMELYPEDAEFKKRLESWVKKGWTIAMHGYDHVYSSKSGGINPVNQRSEFAGLSLSEQKEKISAGVLTMRGLGIEPRVFFAPSHTFDENTLEALRQCSNIRIISDTIANKPYCRDGFTFVPQQSGRARKLPFRYVTFCYHPNEMKDADFEGLEAFLKEHSGEFIDFPQEETDRKLSAMDRCLRLAYFSMRAVKRKLHGK